MSNIISYDINQIYNDILYFISQPNFIKLAQNSVKSTRADWLTSYFNIQSDITTTMRSNDMISLIAITDQNDYFYSLLEIGQKTQYLSYTKEIIDSSPSGIYWLPTSENPFSTQEGIPIVFPLIVNDTTQLPMYIASPTTPDLNVIVYLSNSYFNLYLNRLNKTTLSTVYLANSDGTPINSLPDPTINDLINLSVFQEKLGDVESITQFEYDISSKDTYMIYAYPLGINNLKLVSIAPKNLLFEELNNIAKISFGVLLFSLLIAVLISFVLSKILTAPIKGLTNLVKTLNPYESPLQLKSTYKDEIGVLTNALTDMSQIIHQQMLHIKEEEYKKHQAELNILTEQINPHFLYNTLECIHWEILNKKIEVSAQMIQNLGVFLRLSLDSHDNMLPIRDEIQLTQKYLSIMNLRTSSAIELSYHISENLMPRPMPRLLLQPLVENCIKHGFSDSSYPCVVSIPHIDISIYEDTSYMYIVVSDNGKGIDITKAEASILCESTSEHKKIGLHNIHQRIISFYGPKATIAFTSIPFFRNEVILKIPLTSI